MKIKQKPEDFVVEEQSEFTLDEAGKIYVYRLAKKSLSTLDALRIIRQRFHIKNKQMQICGLKDKHSVSTQLLSCSQKIPEIDNDERLKLTFLGKSKEHIGSDNLLGNRFIITVRDLTEREIEQAKEELVNIMKFGLVNYFDSQRFGSVRHGNAFIARELIAKNYERAVKIFLTATSNADKSKEKRRKNFIAEHWGNFEYIDKNLPPCEQKPLISHLRRQPRDFVGALLKIGSQLRNMLIHAYQSYIWNRTAKRYLLEKNAAHLEANYSLGKLYFYRELSDEMLAEFRALQIPLIRHDTKIKDALIKRITEEVLEAEGLSFEKFRLKTHPAFRFKEHWREFVLMPKQLEFTEFGDDELNPNKKRATFTLTLGKGAYATLIIKRLFQSTLIEL